MPKTLKERFWQRVKPREPNQCWLWQGSCNGGPRGGYGFLRVEGRVTPVHRVSWLLHFGEVPDGQHVRHACENRSCVNPRHLQLGTQADSMQLMHDLRRHSRYGGAPLLSHEAAEAIRERARWGWPRRRLAQTYGVAESTIGDVIRGYTWNAR